MELESRLLLPQRAKEAASRAYLFPPDINTSPLGSTTGGSNSGGSGSMTTGSGSGGNSNSDAIDSSLATSIGPPQYSAILFGPPGTAKTTICTSVASYLGWNFLTIDTASFLSNGLQVRESQSNII